MKRFITLLLTLCLALSLAACGKKEEVPIWHTEEKTLDLPEEMASVTAQYIVDDQVYIGGLGTTKAVFGRIAPDGTWTNIELPDDYEFICALCEVDGNIGMLAGSFPASYNGSNGEQVTNEAETRSLDLLVLDSDGSLVARFSLPVGSPDYNQMIFAENCFVVKTLDSIVKLSVEGQELERIDADEGKVFFSMVQYDDDIVVCACEPDENSSAIYTLDTEAFQLDMLLELPRRLLTGLGISAAGELLVCDEDEAGSVDLETGTYSSDFTYTDIGLAAQSIQTITPWNGDLLLYWRYQNSLHIAKSVFSSGNDKTELLLVTDMVLSPVLQLQELVNAFNDNNEEYHITIKILEEPEYTEDMLRMEIIAGKAPDIYAFFSFSTLNNVGDAGLYEDLLPYLDADPEYGRETLIPSLLNVMSRSGKLDWMPCDFMIYTFTAPESIIPEPGITVEELKAVMEGQDRFSRAFRLEKYILTAKVMSFAAGKFIDFKNGTCTFDSPEFVSLLEMCNTMAAEVKEGENLHDELPLLLNTAIQSEVFYDKNFGSGDYCFVGFPNDSGNGSMISTNLKLAISSQSEHKDAAWGFLRTALSMENQMTFTCLPSTQAAMEERISKLFEAEPMSYSRPFVQEDADKFWNMLNNITVLLEYDSILNDIIVDEATAYFSGDKTAEEAAAIIQSRVSLYLGEQQ